MPHCLRHGLRRRRALTLLPAAAAAPWLAACGGGDQAPGEPPAPTEKPLRVGGEGTGRMRAAAARLSDLGSSVVLAGLRFDNSHSRLWREIDPRAPQARPLSDLRLGMQLQLLADDLMALDITVAPLVLGAVQRVVDDSRLLVAGQTVLVHTSAAEPTLFDGLRELEELLPGDHVEVHGERDARGRVRASRLVRVADEPLVRVSGTVTQSDPVARVLTVGALWVDGRNSGLTSALWPRIGQTVVAFGPSGPQPQRLLAQTVQVRSPALSEGLSMRLAGVISAWQSPASFVLQGVRVDARPAGLPAAELAELGAGSLVELAGEVQRGRLRAQALRIVDDDEPLRGEIRAAVSGWAGDGRFVLRGTPIDTQAATFEALTAANLGNGVPLSVRGEVHAGGISADHVLALTPAPGEAFVKTGIVDDFDATSGQFLLDGLPGPCRVDAATTYVGGSAGLLADRIAVQLRGALIDGVFVVATLTFGGGDAVVELSGLASAVESELPGQGEFEVNLSDCVWDTATVFFGPTNSAADLVNGRCVQVRGRREASVVRALEIDARSSLTGLVRLRGTVSEFVALSQFRIDGQRIDASAAVFDPPSLASALAGAWVDVEGRLSDGVLIASSVAES